MVRGSESVSRLVGSVIVAFFLAGCSSLGYQNELGQSLATWQRLKAENGGHYRYETSFASWAGFGYKTTLTVQDETVVARAYEAYEQDGNTGETTVTESWLEEGSAIGSHEAGADPVTIDVLYERCREEILPQNSQANEIYLDFLENGVLETCKYRPYNCEDDCLFGISIDRLEFLKD